MKKVLVGMSGGVDSSVAALILKNQGYEVFGLTLDFLNQDSDTTINDARITAKKLKIPHKVLKIKDKFTSNVIDYFISEYQSGRTPNPCIVCNKRIKFGVMLDFALKQGFDYIATGHYANVEYDKWIGRWLLRKSRSSKDQSYFLYNLSQKQLQHSLFPIGDLEKIHIRQIAERYGLPTSSKSDSQDICFIKNTNIPEFISKHSSVSVKPGEFIDKNGVKIGTHNGIVNYTIGQRKGLGLAMGKPVYVTNIDVISNSVTVGDKEEGNCKELIIQDTNWIIFDKLVKKTEAFAKIRYKAQQTPCSVEPSGEDSARITFEIPATFPAPGQSVVLYNKDNIVIGGGIIK